MRTGTAQTFATSPVTEFLTASSQANKDFVFIGGASGNAGGNYRYINRIGAGFLGTDAVPRRISIDEGGAFQFHATSGGVSSGIVVDTRTAGVTGGTATANVYFGTVGDAANSLTSRMTSWRSSFSGIRASWVSPTLQSRIVQWRRSLPVQTGCAGTVADDSHAQQCIRAQASSSRSAHVPVAEHHRRCAASPARAQIRLVFTANVPARLSVRHHRRCRKAASIRHAELRVGTAGGRWTLQRGDFQAEWDAAERRGWIRQTLNPYAIDCWCCASSRRSCSRPTADSRCTRRAPCATAVRSCSRTHRAPARRRSRGSPHPCDVRPMRFLRAPDRRRLHRVRDAVLRRARRER